MIIQSVDVNVAATFTVTVVTLQQPLFTCQLAHDAWL